MASPEPADARGGLHQLVDLLLDLHPEAEGVLNDVVVGVRAAVRLHGRLPQGGGFRVDDDRRPSP